MEPGDRIILSGHAFSPPGPAHVIALRIDEDPGRVIAETFDLLKQAAHCRAILRADGGFPFPIPDSPLLTVPERAFPETEKSTWKDEGPASDATPGRLDAAIGSTDILVIRTGAKPPFSPVLIELAGNLHSGRGEKCSDRLTFRTEIVYEKDIS
jgi:hypothetical protein